MAVVDEGVMYNHEDLANNMWINPAETFGSDEDADGNGYAGDKYGYNLLQGMVIFHILKREIRDMRPTWLE